MSYLPSKPKPRKAFLARTGVIVTILAGIASIDVAGSDGAVALSGLKNQLRRVRPDFSEKKLGYRSFLQFCKAAATSAAVDLQWNPEADDYLLTANP